MLPFAKSVRVGDEVIALGHPLNLGGNPTITKGIVSAFRNYNGVEQIQTDAAINPGNSGGPLLNTKGQVIGMNTSSVDQSNSGRPVEGIGFAIKFNVLSTRLTAMKVGGHQAPTPTPTPRAVATQIPGYVFGPESGSIAHDPYDGFIDTYHADVSVSDAVIEARFFNPYSIQDGSWSSGFMFRSGRFNEFHILGIHSGGYWYHHLRTGDVENQQNLASEYSNHIDTTAHGSNRIRIITNGPQGWLFINDAFVATLDLSGLTVAGGVSVVGSYFQDDGIAGQSTRFENFTITSLQKVYGPINDSIEHDIHDTGYIDTYNSQVSITNGIIEARFTNPYASWQGDWSSGFMLRYTSANEFHIIGARSSNYWFHYLRTGNVDTEQELAIEYSQQVITSSTGSNHILIIALNELGWLFINGVFISELDLRGKVEVGRVSAIGTYFLNDGIAGYSTRFENFTIWSAD